MDIPVLIAMTMSTIATLCAAVALYVSLRTRRLLTATSDLPQTNKNEYYAQIANMLSDGSMVWQRMMVSCDELSSMIPGTLIHGATRETMGAWLLQLRDFSKDSKTEIDHAYQLFATETRHMSADDMERQLPDMEKFSKEMKSNVAVISDQLEHTRRVLRGTESPSKHQFKITLHKPQVMPHFLRKRQKIAELQRRRNLPAASTP